MGDQIERIGSACVVLMHVFFFGLVSAWVNYDILNSQVYSFDQSDELLDCSKPHKKSNGVANKQPIQSDLLIIIRLIRSCLLLTLNYNILRPIIFNLLLPSWRVTTLINAITVVAGQHLVPILLKISPEPGVLVCILDAFHRNLVFRLFEMDIVFALIVIIDDFLGILDHVHGQSFVSVALP